MSATSAMLRLFSDWPERDVGGFALPYFLTWEGAFLRGYGYSVSDPIAPQMRAGSIIHTGQRKLAGLGSRLRNGEHMRALSPIGFKGPEAFYSKGPVMGIGR